MVQNKVMNSMTTAKMAPSLTPYRTEKERPIPVRVKTKMRNRARALAWKANLRGLTAPSLSSTTRVGLGGW